MLLICETRFPPRMSVTITFLTYSSYTSQSTASFIPVYLFIARQSRDRAWVRVKISIALYGDPHGTYVVKFW